MNTPSPSRWRRVKSCDVTNMGLRANYDDGSWELFEENEATRWLAKEHLALVATIKELRSENREQLAELIPTTWLDPLLSGPNAVIPITRAIVGTDIENLLRMLKLRIQNGSRE